MEVAEEAATSVVGVLKVAVVVTTEAMATAEVTVILEVGAVKVVMVVVVMAMGAVKVAMEETTTLVVPPMETGGTKILWVLLYSVRCVSQLIVVIRNIVSTLE
ncbi:hypothetical protein Nepgr_015197 [Nepenthes gracilis]|uniref:Uncharacterized protein n=1 Tax=Nepenthes gracilis TaxID=150966 RepID=A0AAD3SMS6_NEPGR|nr:hypothetical protein Nepgr_015197 [Nepenthes gracilis]